MFKAKAYLDLKRRKEIGEGIDSSDVRKHKKEILCIALELKLEHIVELPLSVSKDMNVFINLLEAEPFDQNMLKIYGLTNADVISSLRYIYET